MERRTAIGLLAAALGGSLPRAQGQASRENVAWVSQVLKKMETIQPGMTRADLLTVFTTEGGLSTALQRTYVSRDCPYFKVEVAFEAVGRPDRDSSGRVIEVEDNRDKILKISQPYLEFTVLD